MITATSRYAIRALVRLALLSKDELIGGKELSADLEIPANYLSKVMHNLRNSGFVEAVRGFHGGYKLQKPAQKIHLVDVVELFEGIYSRPRCFLGKDHVCSDQNPCAAHNAFKGARVAYVRFLERTTIASLAKKELELRTKDGTAKSPKHVSLTDIRTQGRH